MISSLPLFLSVLGIQDLTHANKSSYTELNLQHGLIDEWGKKGRYGRGEGFL